MLITSLPESLSLLGHVSRDIRVFPSGEITKLTLAEEEKSTKKTNLFLSGCLTGSSKASVRFKFPRDHDK